MPVRVRFTRNLERHLSVPSLEVDAGSLRQVLEAVFARHPQARGFVMDDQGALRHHMVVFVNGEQTQDRLRLGEIVSDGSEVYVMQALSGG
jgi:sulfur-carrier protein